MFTIIISEKGGAERREIFDRNEINVGRVQGNDLMLPKGNVSKHHARLLYRDGRFIVTDLKSTNGTYVNGRKISQATIVREGDKIYIGDFVLRLEAGQPPTAVEGDDGLSRPGIRAVTLPREAGASSSPPRDPHSGPATPVAQVAAMPSLSLPPSPSHRGVESPSVSHFPLERDPDSENAIELQGTPQPRVPGPPRLPQPEVKARAATAMQGLPFGAPAPRAVSRPTLQEEARRRALVALVDRVADSVDLSALDASPVVAESLAQRIQAATNEQSKAMHDEGEAPATVDLELLAREALRELVGLGAIGPLLEDDQAEEILVPRPDLVLTVRNGHASVAGSAFTSAEALARTVARLAHQSGDALVPGESIVDRRLHRGARMIAVGPPVASMWTLAIRKPIRAEGSLEDQVRAGALSRPMALLLEACVGARANLLVVGRGAGLVAPMIAALTYAAEAGERVAILADADDIHVGHAYVTRLALADGDARDCKTLWAATRLRPDRLVVASLAGSVGAATVDAVSDGNEGVIAGLYAPSLRHGFSRLAAQVALSRPGASIEAARAAVAESFQVALEVSRSIDGRVRIARLVELGGTDAMGIVAHDLFLQSADGTGEAGFVATGVTPRFVQEFSRRGIKVDSALFRRGR